MRDNEEEEEKEEERRLSPPTTIDQSLNSADNASQNQASLIVDVTVPAPIRSPDIKAWRQKRDLTLARD